MAQIVGRRNYSERSGRIVQNVLPTILQVDPNLNDAGFLAFYEKVGTEGTPQEKFTWDTDDWLALTDTTSAAVASTTTTTIPVSNPTYFSTADLWKNKRTGEIMRVTSVNVGTSNIEVTRAVTALNSSGGTAAANINSGDTLIRLAPVVGENNSRLSFNSTTPTEVFNYTTALRWEIQFSERQLKRQFENDNEGNYHIQKTLKQVRKDLNGFFIDSERARYTSADQGDVTISAGINSVITTNTFSVGGVLYENDLDEWLVEEALRYGSKDKVMFASTDVILAIVQIGKERLGYEFASLAGKKGEIGIQVMNYLAPNGGRLMIVEDRFLSEAHNGDAFICDMSELKRKVFSGNGISGDVHMISNTQDPDDNGTFHTIRADMGLMYGIEKYHAKLTNVSGGAKGNSCL